MFGVKCLFGKHDWRFLYNHGMPLGIDIEHALRMLSDKEAYGIDACTRCGKQSRVTNGQRILLTRSEIEKP